MRVGQGLRSLGGSSPGESECAGELREDILSDIEATISHSYESLNVDIHQDIPSDIEETGRRGGPEEERPSIDTEL